MLQQFMNDSSWNAPRNAEGRWNPAALRFLRRGFLAVLLSTFCLVGAGKVSHAQLTTADLLGTVTDTSGAVIPGATVTLKNLETGVIATTKTNGTGDYIFNLLPPGHYSVAIESEGFKKDVYPDIALAAGDRAREDGKLETGANTETVEVSAAPPLLQTDTAAVTSVVTERAVQDLPLNGRNFVNLVQIQPGVNAGQPNSISSGARPDDRRMTSTISANGQSDQFNNQMIEGMDNNEREQGFLGVRPSIDAIAEVEVDTNAYSAEVGRDAGAVVNIITKSGTDAFHGTAYEFFRNDIFDSRDFFTTVASGAPKPEYRQNQFGGSLGGPIIKNKTFFFADVENNRDIVGEPSGLLTVPTAQERDTQKTGVYNFSDNGGTPLPAAYANPVGLAYLNMYPLPNTGAAGATSNNFVSAPKQPQMTLSLDGRIDQHFGNGDLLFGRYSYNNVNTQVPGDFPAVQEANMTIQPGGNFLAYPGSSITKAHGVQFDYVHALKTNLIMELKTGYTRIDITTRSLNSGQNVSSAIGVINANTPAAPETSGLTPAYFPNASYADVGDSVFLPILDRNNTFQDMGSLIYTHGGQNIKAGFQFTRRQLNYFQNDYGLGAAFFEGLSGNVIEDMVEGFPVAYERTNTLIEPGYRASEYGAYVQDDWRITHSLTLNLGLRYDIFDPITEAHDRYANFEYNTTTNNGTLILGSQSPHVGIATNYKNIAPRVGFSQSLGQRTVLRGGFGISYYPSAIQGAINLANPPYTYASGLVLNPVLFGGANFWPNMPVPQPSSTTSPSGGLSYVTSNFNTAYVEQFNLMLQREFGANVVTVGGVGELDRHMLFQTNINTPAPNGPYPNDATLGPSPTPALLTATTLPNVTQILADTPWGTGNYYAGQVVFARRFSNGLSFNANYTWAHGLSDGYSGSGGGTALGLLATDPHYDYGNSSVDIRNRFAASATYRLPFGEHTTGSRALLLKGWESNAIIFWQSGQTFAVGDAYDNQYSVAQINLPDVTADRPSIVAGQSFRTAKGALNNWLNLAAFTPQPAGTPGDEQSNAFQGPHERRADLSLFKSFNVTERLTAQFRAECYNISNTPNFSTPNSTISAWAPGPEHTPTTPISVVGLLPGDTPASGTTFGTITSTVNGVNPRQFQFALKVLF